MSRRPNPERRLALLDEVVAYVRIHGIASLTLRPLASSLQTSPRNLLYHFQSSNTLINLIVERIQEDDLEKFQSDVADLTFSNMQSLLEKIWEFLSLRRDSVRVYLELAMLAFETPQEITEFMHKSTGPWGEKIRSTLVQLNCPEESIDEFVAISISSLWGAAVVESMDASDGTKTARLSIERLGFLLDQHLPTHN